MADKSTKKEAHYRQRPNKGDKCALCTMFRKPHGCTAVTGTISPVGWCSYFKSRKEQHFDEGGRVEDGDTSGDTSSQSGDTSSPGAPLDISPPPTQDQVEPGNKIPSMRDAYASWQQQYTQLPEGVKTGWDPQQGPQTPNLHDKAYAKGAQDWKAQVYPGSDTPIRGYAQGGKVPDWMDILTNRQKYIERGFDYGGLVDDDDDDVPPQEEPGAPPPVQEPEPLQQQEQQSAPPQQFAETYDRSSRTDSPTVDDGEPQRLPATNLGRRSGLSPDLGSPPAAPKEQPAPTQQPEEKGDSSLWGSLGRTFARSAGTAGIGLGPIAGAAAAGTALAGPIGGVAAGIGAGFFGGDLFAKAERWAADLLGLDSPEQRAADEKPLEQHPYLKLGAELAGSGPTFFSAKNAGLAARSLWGGVGGATDVAQQYMEKGDVDWKEALAHAAAGAVWATPNRLGSPIIGAAERLVGHAIPGRPNLDHPENPQAEHDATDGASEPPKTARGVAQAQPPPKDDRSQPTATLSVVGDEGNTGRFAKRLRDVSVTNTDANQVAPDVAAALKEGASSTAGQEEVSPSQPQSREETPTKQKTPFEQTNPDGSPQEFGQRKSLDIQSAEAHQGDEAIEAMQRRGEGAKEKPELPEAPHPDEAVEAMQRAPGAAAEHPELPEALPEGSNERKQFGQHTPELEDQYRRSDVGELPEAREQFGKRAAPPGEEAVAPPQFGKRMPVPLTGNKQVDGILQHPVVQEAMANPSSKVIRGYDVPYGAGAVAARNRGEIYVGNTIPTHIEVAKADGSGRQRIPVDPLLVLHENVEKQYIEGQIDKLGREPTPDDMRRFYAEGHKIASHVEESVVRAAGLDVKDYNKIWEGLDRRSESAPIRRAPPDLYLAPYPHELRAQLEYAGTQPQPVAGGPPEAAARIAAISQARSQPGGTPPGGPIATALPAQPLGGGGVRPPGGPPGPKSVNNGPAPPNQPPPPAGNASSGRTPWGQPQIGAGQPNRFLRLPGGQLASKGMEWVATNLGKGSPGRGIAGAVNDYLYGKDNRITDATNQVRQAWNAAKVSNKPKNREDIYTAMDANDLAALPKKLRNAYDAEGLKQIQEASNLLRSNMRAQGYGDDVLGRDTENGLHRVTKNWIEDPNNLKSLFGEDTFLNEHAAPGKQFVTHFGEDRDYMALENAAGDRKVISVHRGEQGYTEWNNRKVVAQNRDPAFDPHIRSLYTDPKTGETWQVRDALTHEIEKHGLDANGKPLEYVHDPWVSTMVGYLRQLRLAHDVQAIKELKTDPKLAPYLSKEAKEGFVPINGPPEFRGYYADPAVARTLDMYRRPGFQDDRLNGLRRFARFVTKTMFWNPVIHPLNVEVHYIEGRGLRWLNPAAYGRMIDAHGLGMNELTNPGTWTQRFLDNGATLMFQKTMAAQLQRGIGNTLKAAVASNPQTYAQVAKTLGMKSSDLMGSIYNQSSKAMWAAGDLPYYAAMFEHLMEIAPKGNLSKVTDDHIKEAVNQVNKYMPTYRLPESIMGSAFLTALSSEPLTFAFGPYHHALLNSHAQNIRDVIRGNTQERIEAAGRLAALGTLGYVVYPWLNDMAKKLTGDDSAEFRGRGPLTLPMMMTKFAQGQNQEGPFGVMKELMMPGMMARTVAQALNNEDWRGKHIVEPERMREAMHGNIGSGIQAFGQEASHLLRGAIQPLAQATQDIHSGRSPTEAIRNQLLNIKQTTPASAKWQLKQAQRDQKDALRRQRRTDDPIEQFFNQLGEMTQ